MRIARARVRLGLGLPRLDFTRLRRSGDDLENASEPLLAARHPRCLVSQDDADRLPGRRVETGHAAELICGSASRDRPPEAEPSPATGPGDVRVEATGCGRSANDVVAGSHGLRRADEPESPRGHDTGPAPSDPLSASLSEAQRKRLLERANRCPADRTHPPA